MQLETPVYNAASECEYDPALVAQADIVDNACIMFGGRKPYCTPLIQVFVHSRADAEDVRRTLGSGSILERLARQRRTSNAPMRMEYTVNVRGASAVELCRTLLPLLDRKAEHARVILRYADAVASQRRRIMSEAEEADRWGCIMDLRALNAAPKRVSLGIPVRREWTAPPRYVGLSQERADFLAEVQRLEAEERGAALVDGE